MEKNPRTHTTRKIKRQAAASRLLPVSLSQAPPLPAAMPDAHPAPGFFRTSPPPSPAPTARKAKKTLRSVLYKDYFDLLPCFVEAMRHLELAVDAPRMQFDRIYGVEQLLQAQKRGDASLRQIALVLMTMYAIR